ncbi:twin-arginine translocation signal domain-containing protein, partial [Vibrio cholerae]|uniref:twin-arginine translocation signal domain-containing protein n=1 Tax=Vibrio cholerae TaxID=666 RepID=UPI0034E0C7F1
MNRRHFIKAASCGALLTGALPSVSHAAAENRPPGTLLRSQVDRLYRDGPHLSGCTARTYAAHQTGCCSRTSAR